MNVAGQNGGSWFVQLTHISHSAALQPLTGKLYTHLRKKDVFLAHLFLFELGSLVCGLAGSSSMLIAGRAVAGLGSAGLMNGSLTILADGAPMEKRPCMYMVF
jgi:MFS family permease